MEVGRLTLFFFGRPGFTLASSVRVIVLAYVHGNNPFASSAFRPSVKSRLPSTQTSRLASFSLARIRKTLALIALATSSAWTVLHDVDAAVSPWFCLGAIGCSLISSSRVNHHTRPLSTLCDRVLSCLFMAGVGLMHNCPKPSRSLIEGFLAMQQRLEQHTTHVEASHQRDAKARL